MNHLDLLSPKTDAHPHPQHDDLTQFQFDQNGHPIPLSPTSNKFKTNFYDPFQVKHRKRTTKEQFLILESVFMHSAKPSLAVRKALAVRLGMTPRGVQVWFQNRRSKAKLNNESLDRPLAYDPRAFPFASHPTIAQILGPETLWGELAYLIPPHATHHHQAAHAQQAPVQNRPHRSFSISHIVTSQPYERDLVSPSPTSYTPSPPLPVDFSHQGYANMGAGLSQSLPSTSSLDHHYHQMTSPTNWNFPAVAAVTTPGYGYGHPATSAPFQQGLYQQQHQ
ncbi:homeobox-domain-containing protein [Conidiobolus coronatus NRRL 28638]|uniref:Homeobox-domain-containing protein n=1 Tax=Conidiobolus coronatus (strain ATCC 28846 / CBS 209.66 / NRRL 28638) TaxID=796925 RepID=A0A137NUZ5_CONC2|nr:homeobox-domain-containing protein [Conidiobolus coronatus NRRL 28638]|eukprot:KXN66498.1 homeobox-domain-containing protein [Conidiobolus coronatus NRRL 28638]